jgi:membrane-associated HD superfamily phosphohydrolase
MCEHLKKTQKGTLLIEKVIDSALKLRLKKGDLSLSGLTAGDLTVIRNTMVDVIKEDMF